MILNFDDLNQIHSTDWSAEHLNQTEWNDVCVNDAKIVWLIGPLNIDLYCLHFITQMKCCKQLIEYFEIDRRVRRRLHYVQMLL